jgi:hypothetical protein
MKRIINYEDFILETSKYKDIKDERFLKLFDKIIKLYAEKNPDHIMDFKEKLYEFLSSDEHKMFKVNFLVKPKGEKLIDLIHRLDNYLSLIFIRRKKNAVINVNREGLKPIWKDDKRKIYVYRANNVFESIKLGSDTKFCISSSIGGRKNYFYDYMYDYFQGYTIYDTNYDPEDRLGEQHTTIYFVLSPTQNENHKVLAIDKLYEGSSNYKYRYTDMRNKDVMFHSYDDMINGNEKDYDNLEDEIIKTHYTSTDLQHIPEDVFKFVVHYPNLEELKFDKRLFWRLDNEPLIESIIYESVYTLDDYFFIHSNTRLLIEDIDFRKKVQKNMSRLDIEGNILEMKYDVVYLYSDDELEELIYKYKPSTHMCSYILKRLEWYYEHYKSEKFSIINYNIDNMKKIIYKYKPDIINI